MLVQPGNRSVRSCVRASEAACARETMLFPWLGDFSEMVLQGGGAARALPRRWSRRAFSSLLVASKWFLVVSNECRSV